MPAGRYELSNLPTLSGSGTAQVVLRDAAGREITTSLPFFTSTSLLRQGLFDFSAQVGAPRLSYATSSFDYELRPVATGGARYGVTDWLTVEAYGEGSANLANAGAGIAFDAGGRAVISVAGRASMGRANTGREERGYLGYASVETTIFGLTVSASTQRTFANFSDLAASVSRAAYDLGGFDWYATRGLDEVRLVSARLPRSLDRLAVGVPVPALGGTLGFGFINRVDSTEARRSSRLLNASYGMALWGRATLAVTAFTDLQRSRNIGAFASLSTPIGFGDARVGAGATRDTTGRLQGVLEASQAPGLEAGSFGWRARVVQGQETGGSAGATYRSGVAQFDAQVDQFQRGGTRARVEADGALVLLGGEVYATNRIGEAFAVADVGAPEVEVLHQNRRIGRTNASGRVLVPNLVPGQRNRIAIDPAGLPVDADIGATMQTVVPDNGGLTVAFGVEAKARGIRLVLHDAAGQPLAPGWRGRVSGSDEVFVVGYDGQAYLRNAPRAAVLTIERPGGTSGGTCSTTVPDLAGGGAMPPLVCR